MTRRHPQHFESVYLTATGAFYPGEPVGNERIDEYVEPINGASSRINVRYGNKYSHSSSVTSLGYDFLVVFIAANYRRASI